MKPILLEMTAFGSYKDKTVIDFERLTHGLYLITGDTGAGKTTIFDAIMFALYGTASGTARLPEMMHCDFVDKSVDTEVKLCFRQGGRDYTVSRNIHYRKKRGTEDQYSDGIVNALLYEPGKDPIDGATRVTERCTALLGLNADQFRKIIMLAQGEFKEFLTADGGKKNEILGRLFDNTAYVWYQNLLAGARDALEADRNKQEDVVQSAMQSHFLLPEGEEGTDLYLPEHPELVDNLNKLVEADRKHLEELKEQREKYRQQEGTLKEKKGAAEGQNNLLDDFDKQRAHLDELKQQAEEMRELQATVDAVEKALHQVQPKRETLKTAEEMLSNIDNDIEGLQEILEIQAGIVKTAQETVDEDEPVKQGILNLRVKVQKIQDTLPKYVDLETKLSEKQTAEKNAQETERNRDNAREQCEGIESSLEDIAQEQENLSGIDVQVVEREGRYQKAQKDTAALTGETGIQSRVTKVLAEERDLAVQQERLEELTKEAGAAVQDHLRLYQAFINGQAGIMADGLRKDLAEHGEAVCPVCHSAFHIGEDSGFAVCPEETPRQDQVDAAREDMDKKEADRRKQDRKTADLRTSVDHEKTYILRDAATLLPDCTSWDVLTEEGYLAQKIQSFRETERQAKESWEEAVKRQERSGELAKKKETLEDQRDGLTKDISVMDKELADCQKEIAGLEEAIKEKKDQLQYKDKAAAEEEIRAGEKQLGEWLDLVEEHEKALTKAKDVRQETNGSVEGLKMRRPALVQAKVDAESALRSALEQAGFSSTAEVDRALLPVEGDGESWLKARQKKLSDYDNDYKNTQNRVQELAAQTEGLTYTDLDELQEQIDEMTERYNTANTAYVDWQKLLENHQETAETVAHARAELARSEQAWKRLDLLANLAVGVSGDGGKLSFDRYVMGTVFKEILEMANRRLNIMSGGKYELLHQVSADRKNAQAGLEVEAMDMTTGKLRNSKSLSGGESFLVSLALALGLSDVVQRHAGGRQLDALFIDEGFGSLDNDTLDTALTVLDQLTEGDCLVGIISHVSKLEESIPQKIRVRNGRQGSSLQFE